MSACLHMFASVCQCCHPLLLLILCKGKCWSLLVQRTEAVRVFPFTGTSIRGHLKTDACFKALLWITFVIYLDYCFLGFFGFVLFLLFNNLFSLFFKQEY